MRVSENGGAGTASSGGGGVRGGGGARGDGDGRNKKYQIVTGSYGRCRSKSGEVSKFATSTGIVDEATGDVRVRSRQSEIQNSTECPTRTACFLTIACFLQIFGLPDGYVFPDSGLPVVHKKGEVFKR
jgi:hypothetical protein